VWLVNTVIATVTIKIHAHLDHPVHLARLVPMETTVLTAGKAKVEPKALVKGTNVHQHLLDAKIAHLVPKDPLDLPDPLDNLVPEVVQVTEVEMDVPAAALPVQLVKLEHPDPTVNLVPEVKTVAMPNLEARALLVEKVKTAVPVTLATEETMAPPVILARLVLPVDLVRLVDLVKRVTEVNLVRLVNLALTARMPNIVPALIIWPNIKPVIRHPTF